MKSAASVYTLCAVKLGHPNRRQQAASRAAAGSRFKEARLLCMLSIPDTAKLLRVSQRTVHNWEAGRVRIPYAAFKLMRILRGFELPGHHWKGYRLVGDTLWSPENHPFRASDQTWWSLTVRMAHEFRRMAREAAESRAARGGDRTADLAPAEAAPGVRSTGLVYSSTSEKGISQTPAIQGFLSTAPRLAPGPVVAPIEGKRVRQGVAA